MKLTLNKEFLYRHLFALAVFACLGGWFGLDAFCRYPATPARDLYVAIDKAEPPEGMTQAQLEAFKAGKVRTQRVLAGLVLLAAVATGLHLAAVASQKFSFDDEGFAVGSRRVPWSAKTEADASRWESKRILRLRGDGWRTTLDAWHHNGVREFYAKYCENNRSAGGHSIRCRCG